MRAPSKEDIIIFNCNNFYHYLIKLIPPKGDIVNVVVSRPGLPPSDFPGGGALVSDGGNNGGGGGGGGDAGGGGGGGGVCGDG